MRPLPPLATTILEAPLPPDSIPVAGTAGAATTVRMQKPDGTLWDIPQENSAKAQSAGWTVVSASAAPGPLKRLLTSAAGVPESTDTSLAGAARDLPSLADPSTWLASLKTAIASLNPVPGYREANATAQQSFAQPGVGNKVSGAVEALESGIPYAGPALVRSTEQMKKGDFAGGVGSAFNSAVQMLMMRGMPKEMAETIARNSPAVQSVLTHGVPSSIATGPARTVAQAVEGVGVEPVADARAAYESNLAKVRSDYQADLQKARVANQSADVTNAADHRQRLQSIADADAKAATDYRAKVSKLTDAFTAGQAALAQSNSLAAKLSNDLPALRARARAQAKAAYPDISGTVDSTDIHADLQSALDARLKGTNRSPASIARIMGETKAPADALEQASVFRGGGGRSSGGGGNISHQATPISQAGLPPAALAKLLSEMDPTTRALFESTARQGANATGAPLPFDTLHGYYSELGREMSRRDLPGDERAALSDARARILDRMNGLANAENKGTEFAAAQKGWHQLENTFYNDSSIAAGGSPLARALRAADPVTGKLRPDYVRSILADPKAFAVAKEHLARYTNLGAPVDDLAELKRTVDLARRSPQKLTLPKEPEATPLPSHPATPYTLPPAPIAEQRPFDPVAARRAILQRRTPGEITPTLSFFGIRQMLRALQHKLGRIGPIQDYLSQNPR